MKNSNSRVNALPFTIRPLSDEEGGGFTIGFLDACLCDEILKTGVETSLDAARKSAYATSAPVTDSIQFPGMIAEGLGVRRAS